MVVQNVPLFPGCALGLVAVLWYVLGYGAGMPDIHTVPSIGLQMGRQGVQALPLFGPWIPRLTFAVCAAQGVRI